MPKIMYCTHQSIPHEPCNLGCSHLSEIHSILLPHLQREGGRVGKREGRSVGGRKGRREGKGGKEEGKRKDMGEKGIRKENNIVLKDQLT